MKILGRRIPRLDMLSDDEVVDVLKQILDAVKNIKSDKERETFDFKLTYKLTNKEKVRKYFAAFANTSGGLIIVGVDNDGIPRGITSVPPDERLRQILSERNRITPAPNYLPQEITYNGVNLLIYQIFESPVPVEVYHQDQWLIPARFGSTTRWMSEAEIMLKWYRGVRRVPEGHRWKLDSVGFYSPKDTVVSGYETWKTLNPDSLYRELVLPYSPAIYIPAPTDILSSSELYHCKRRWNGDIGEIYNGVLVELEEKIHQIGIVYNCWSVSTDCPKTFTEAHTYRTGIGATELQKSIAELVPKLRRIHVGWVIISGGSTLSLIGGVILENSVSISVTHIIPFIPNNFPFFYIDEEARIKTAPFPVSRLELYRSFKRWGSSVPDSLNLDKPPEEELAKMPSASIRGYLSPKPRSSDFSSKIRGLTVFSIENASELVQGGFLTEMNPLFCKISHSPMRFNDQATTKVIGYTAAAIPFPNYSFLNFHLILFNIALHINQHSHLKL